MVMYPVCAIGSFAFETLSEAQPACVTGITSGGVFVRNVARREPPAGFDYSAGMGRAGNRIFLISAGPARSPVTLNIGGLPPEFARLEIGSPAQITPGRLAFPEAGIVLNAEGMLPWTPPARPDGSGYPQEARQRLKNLAQHILRIKEGELGFGPLLMNEAKDYGAVTNPVSREELSVALECMTQIQHALRVHDLAVYEAAILKLLGVGRGLTPSGDDFLAGLLLACTRWRDVVKPGFDLEEMKRITITNAYRKTTSLSANIIECAAGGEMDERLVEALDYLYSGLGEESSIAASLAHLGHSSGVDTLVGMAATLMNINPIISQ